MATIKSYTDMEQSKKLAEIVPLESADMCYEFDFDLNMNTKWKPTPIIIEKRNHFQLHPQDIPCWSLAALLSVLPYPSLHKTFSGWRCDSYNKEGTSCIMGNPSDNPIDTCYEMILMLHELKML